MKWMNKLFTATSPAERAAVATQLTNVMQMGRVYPAQQQQAALDYAATVTQGTVLGPGALRLDAGTAVGNIYGRKAAAPPADPNTLPEMQLSLEDAHALWVAKFGAEWVSATSVQAATNFNWTRLGDRLHKAQLLEYAPYFGTYKIIPTSLWK